MPEPTCPETAARDHLALQVLALQYAARELPDDAAQAFEAQLATDPAAQDALAEAVRLSAAALGQPPPAPERAVRAVVRDRLRQVGRLWQGWLARRVYRGHPLAWAVLGAGVLAAAVVIGLQVVGPSPKAAARVPAPNAPPATLPRQPTPRSQAPVAQAPSPRPRPDPAEAAPPTTVDPMHVMAEMWEEMSTPEHVGKVHDEELRWRQHLKEIQVTHPGRTTALGPGSSR